MAKVTTTIPDDDLVAVDAAAKRAGISRSEYMARAATAQAIRDARTAYNTQLAANPALADEVAAARQRAANRGVIRRAAAAATREQEAA